MVIRNMKVLILCSFLLFGLSSVGAQTGVNSISGNVFDEGRRPVTLTFVELLTEYNSVVQRSQTNQAGHYAFTRIPYGKYVVRINPLGTDLEQQEKRVDLYNMSADARREMPMYERVDFYLDKRRSSNSARQVTGVLFAQEVPEEARAIYESIDLNDTSEAAVAKLESAVKIFPKYHDAIVRLGSIYILNQKFAEAESAFLTAVEVYPQGFSGWYGLGHSQFYMNKPAALTSIKKAVDINKNSASAWLILGLAERKSKNYDEALNALLTAKNLDAGKTPDINWNLALLYYHNLKKPAEAADELDNFLKFNKKAKNAEQVKALIKKFRSASPYAGSGK